MVIVFQNINMTGKTRMRDIIQVTPQDACTFYKKGKHTHTQETNFKKKQINRQTDKQTNRQTSYQTNK